MKRLCRISRTRWTLNLIFEPRDLWVGIYWCYEYEAFSIYFSFFPMIVINLIVSKVVQELRDSLSDSTTTTYKFYSRKLEAQEESTKIIEQLARLRKEWELTSEFLRAQGINPECPSMPFFDKLLSAAKNEEEIEAEFEDDDNDDYEEDEE